MSQWIIINEDILRLSILLSSLAIMILWELRRPARKLRYPRRLRWYSNFGIVALNAIILRVMMPVLATGSAFWAEQQGWGILHQSSWPTAINIIIAFLLLDMAMYFQHVLVHAVPLFWRFHRMHHADLDIDTSTGLRFHPVEIVVSMALKISFIITIGAPVLAVLLFEISLSSSSIFNHGNVRLPSRLELLVRRLIVTPDMHRIHHSMISEETNSNYGFSLSIWDHMFGTYRAQPVAGHVDMDIGVEHFRSAKDLHLHRMLIQPFRSVSHTNQRREPDR